jgi:hypothetical protein
MFFKNQNNLYLFGVIEIFLISGKTFLIVITVCAGRVLMDGYQILDKSCGQFVGVLL